MTLPIPDLNELDEALVREIFTQNLQLVREAFPELNLRHGVVGDYVITAMAILQAAMRKQAEGLLGAQDLQMIQTNPEQVSPQILNRIAANYRVQRRTAAVASGEIVIVLDQPLSTAIPLHAEFMANDRSFLADATYVARLSSDLVETDTDRLLTEVGVNRWAFTIGVVAAESGSAGMLRTDTELTPSVQIPGFVQAYVANDFTGGRDEETNTELLARMLPGASAAAFGSRSSIRQLVLSADPVQYPGLSNILAMSVVGIEDPEMFRDQHSLFPISMGKVDLYLRSQSLPSRVSITKEAELIAPGVDGTWRVTIDKKDAPGFYFVRSIRLATALPGTANYAVINQVSSYDMTGETYLPDIQTTQESVFTKYQTRILDFVDTDTDASALAPGTTQEYTLVLEMMPLVDAVQDYLGEVDRAPSTTDVLVKAAVPCFVTVTIDIVRTHADVVVDEAAIRDAVVRYINRQSFVTNLFAGDIAYVVGEHLDDEASASNIQLSGSIYWDGDLLLGLPAGTVLTIPDNPAILITPRTTVFFVAEEDIIINIT